jgi:hypothetical protein
MEKQTKILLGVGAVIAAYLIINRQRPIVTDCEAANSKYSELYNTASGRIYYTGIGRVEGNISSQQSSMKNALKKIDKLGLRNCYEEYIKIPYFLS